MGNGFILPLANALVRLLRMLNLVELFKFVATFYCELRYSHLAPHDRTPHIKAACNVAIDLHQLFKWGVVVMLWVLGIDTQLSCIVVWYLIASNVFTYFYYHVWGSHFVQYQDRDTMNRRFMNMLLAVSFYMVSYAYLYQFHYMLDLKWAQGVVNATNAIYFSVTTSFTIGFGNFVPLNETSRWVVLTEVVNTFLFLTIVITNSVPNHFTPRRENELQE